MSRQWDERKNRLNRQRHKVSFELALHVFDDAFSVTTEDYIDDNGEQRYQTIGFVGVLITVGHVYRVIDGEEKPWIITARKAVAYEENVYWSRQGKH
jgi:uncharacterized DUF497 family protein